MCIGILFQPLEHVIAVFAADQKKRRQEQVTIREVDLGCKWQVAWLRWCGHMQRKDADEQRLKCIEMHMEEHDCRFKGSVDLEFRKS